MLRPTHELIGMTVAADDGEIGTVDRFFFDDRYWTVRHIVVDLGTWLPGRKVLLSPVSAAGIDDSRRRLLIRLTKEKIRNSPDIDTDQPVSRQQEIALHSYYGYAPYWGGGGLWGPAYYPSALVTSNAPAAGDARAAEIPQDEREWHDPHLRSTKEIAGYHLRASDGEIGHVDDFIFDDESWAIRYLVVDTSNWPGGRSVVVPTSWVLEIDWSRLQLGIGATAEAVRERPEYRDLRSAMRDVGVEPRQT